MIFFGTLRIIAMTDARFLLISYQLMNQRPKGIRVLKFEDFYITVKATAFLLSQSKVKKSSSQS